MYKKYHFNSNSESCGPCQNAAPQIINTSNQCNNCHNHIQRCSCNQSSQLPRPSMSPTCVEGLILTTNEDCKMVPLAPVEGRPLTGIIKNGKSIWGVGDAINSYKLEQSATNPNQVKLTSGGNTISTVNIPASTAPIQSISVNNVPIAPNANGNVNIPGAGSSPVQSVSLNGTAVTPNAAGNVDLLVSTGTNGINTITQGFGITANTVAGATTVAVKPSDWVANNPTTGTINSGIKTPNEARNLAADGKSYAPGLTADEFFWYQVKRNPTYRYSQVLGGIQNPGNFSRNDSFKTAYSSLIGVNGSIIDGSQQGLTSTLNVIGTPQEYVVYKESVQAFNRTLTWNEAYRDLYKQAGANANFTGVSGSPRNYERAMFQGHFTLTTSSGSGYVYPEGKPVLVAFEFSNDNFATIYSRQILKTNMKDVTSLVGNSGNGFEGSEIKQLPYTFSVSTVGSQNPSALLTPGNPNITFYWRVKAYAGDQNEYGGSSVSISSPINNQLITFLPNSDFTNGGF